MSVRTIVNEEELIPISEKDNFISLLKITVLKGFVK
jgi:hypothetical protein